MGDEKLTVLVVEDEPLIRFALADDLVDEGFRVIEAASVLEAVAALGRHEVHAIVTDVEMPGGLSGLDLMAMAQAQFPSATVVITSGKDSFQAGLPDNVAFFPKPCDPWLIIQYLNSRPNISGARRVGRTFG
jgi:DNA-binding NtrC family response regulator